MMLQSYVSFRTIVRQHYESCLNELYHSNYKKANDVQLIVKNQRKDETNEMLMILIDVKKYYLC